MVQKLVREPVVTEAETTYLTQRDFEPYLNVPTLATGGRAELWYAWSDADHDHGP